MEKIVYHGSNVIVPSPEISIQKYNKDFYFGFYCTTIAQQAIRWSTRFGTKGILNEYLYTPTPDLKIKVFPDMTEEWLDFIVACRLGHSHDYDTIIIDCLIEVYSSWISEAISNYNSDFFYQSRQYIHLCYTENTICE